MSKTLDEIDFAGREFAGGFAGKANLSMPPGRPLVIPSCLETRPRSVVKALTWRAVATLITVGVAFAVTGEAVLAAAIGGVDAAAKLAAYYAHERFWNRVVFGLQGFPESDIPAVRRKETSDAD